MEFVKKLCLIYADYSRSSIFPTVGGKIKLLQKFPTQSWLTQLQNILHREGNGFWPPFHYSNQLQPVYLGILRFWLTLVHDELRFLNCRWLSNFVLSFTDVLGGTIDYSSLKSYARINIVMNYLTLKITASNDIIAYEEKAWPP